MTPSERNIVLMNTQSIHRSTRDGSGKAKSGWCFDGEAAVMAKKLAFEAIQPLLFFVSTEKK
jgi:hypothetical protein